MKNNALKDPVAPTPPPAPTPTPAPAATPAPPPPTWPQIIENYGVTVNYYYQFGYGIVNGTRIYGGPESRKCK
jgi:hypothetical protein